MINFHILCSIWIACSGLWPTLKIDRRKSKWIAHHKNRIIPWIIIMNNKKLQHLLFVFSIVFATVSIHWWSKWFTGSKFNYSLKFHKREDIWKWWRFFTIAFHHCSFSSQEWLDRFGWDMCVQELCITQYSAYVFAFGHFIRTLPWMNHFAWLGFCNVNCPWTKKKWKKKKNENTQ